MLSELVDEIDAMKTGAKALAVPLDVSDRAAVADQLSNLPAEYADVDVLVIVAVIVTLIVIVPAMIVIQVSLQTMLRVGIAEVLQAHDF